MSIETIVSFFTSNGLVARIAIAILGMELIYSVWFGLIKRGAAASRWRMLIPNALSGVAMLAALWVAMNNDPPFLILVFLTLGFVAHLVDVKLRLFPRTK
jgi:hypothetical protein